MVCLSLSLSASRELKVDLSLEWTGEKQTPKTDVKEDTSGRVVSGKIYNHMEGNTFLSFPLGWTHCYWPGCRSPAVDETRLSVSLETLGRPPGCLSQWWKGLGWRHGGEVTGKRCSLGPVGIQKKRDRERES